MPVSKRAKVQHLSKVQKKDRAAKEAIFEAVRECVSNHPYVYVVRVANMRNAHLKALRERLQPDTRFFFGKNRVLAKALGSTEPEEMAPGLRHIAERLNGHVGLVFSSLGVEAMQAALAAATREDFARAGTRATARIELPAGPLVRTGPWSDKDAFPPNMEPHLRSLGLATSLVKGVVMLTAPVVVCEIGDVLTPERAHILKHLGYPMAHFMVEATCVWADGTFTELVQTAEAMMDAVAMDDLAMKKAAAKAALDADDADADADAVPMLVAA
ncbi:hypothetical protein CXG81DRAFT_17624 [Caulochytrium protostelioides]|uniref:Ribosome assembly factor mrt4 n=1 Tax=Caulochytrium protostelioides TaxID=1555241 RepID=A0A4V1IV41_9FUNG|nr:hypothetical protein CXG81DRAFT_17624 [Caulochytrium protostelioides]|eukprot:RKP02739.1 hypothetical protein CXG81DRAFT_17624 [Caulochytrium protostelioides]